LSLESCKERDAKGSKRLSSLAKWWGGKPLVLVRAIVIGSVFPAAEDPADWPNDLDIFLRCLTLDNAGMWKRKTAPLPAALCWPQATAEEQEVLFADQETWRRGRAVDRELRQTLERRVFYTLPYPEQREYCCRVEQIDGPPPESWAEINAYLGTNAETLPALVQQLAERRYGRRLKVGDAFCGGGSIPFEAAELGCDVYASDLNPVACLLTWGALNIIGGTDAFREQIHAEQRRVYDEVDSWILEQGLETSAEGWRAEAYLYCIEMTVPEWDGWRVPICPTWVIAPKTETWVELVPIETEKRFGFKVRQGGSVASFAAAPPVTCAEAPRGGRRPRTRREAPGGRDRLLEPQGQAASGDPGLSSGGHGPQPALGRAPGAPDPARAGHRALSRVMRRRRPCRH
jgi:adenine-specific DNA methylase